MQDNGLSIQGEKFDFLLDLNNQVIHPSDGEIYVPVYYMQKENIKAGDKIRISGIKIFYINIDFIIFFKFV